MAEVLTQTQTELTPVRHINRPRTAKYLLLAGGFVVAGWFLLPDSARPTDAKKSTISTPTAEKTVAAADALPGDVAAAKQAENALADYQGDLREPGLRHITTLQLDGSYAQAADYAVAAPLEYRRDFTIAAYHEWGRHQPELAIASAIRIEDAPTRDFATHSVLSGWARSDPEGMAETAIAFPDSDFKKAALTRALRAWMLKDPNVAGDWIMAHPDVVPIAEEMFRRDRR